MKDVHLRFILAFFIVIVSTSSAFAGSSKQALTALKKFRSRCEVGISYRDYSKELADANYEVKEYLDSSEAKSNPKLTQCISGALLDYLHAGSLWEFKVNLCPGLELVPPNHDLWKLFIKSYPDAVYLMETRTTHNDILKKNITSTDVYFPEIISYIWKQAGNKIDEASELMISKPATKSRRK